MFTVNISIQRVLGKEETNWVSLSMNEWMDVPKTNNEQRKVTADAGGKSARSDFFMKVGGRRDLKERCEECDWKEEKWRQKSVRRRRKRRREKLNAVTRHTHRCVCISLLRGLEAILSASGFPTYHLIYDQRPLCLCICVSVDVLCVIKPLLIILSAGVTQRNKGTPLPSSQAPLRYLPSLCFSAEPTLSDALKHVRPRGCRHWYCH